VAAVDLGELSVSVVLLLATAVLGIRARRWARLAGSRVGARSENEVQRALAPLQTEGWRLRHSLTWPGRGDIDSVAIAPTGVALAIETKTRNHDLEHLARTHEITAWLRRRRRRWCPRGAVPVLCVVRVRELEQIEQGVLVVSRETG
jgi:hypothetical protein